MQHFVIYCSYPMHFLEDVYLVYKLDALVYHWKNTFGPASPTPFGPSGPAGPAGPEGPWYSRKIKHVSVVVLRYLCFSRKKRISSHLFLGKLKKTQIGGKKFNS